jgi:hypothetical protein
MKISPNETKRPKLGPADGTPPPGGAPAFAPISRLLRQARWRCRSGRDQAAGQRGGDRAAVAGRDHGRVDLIDYGLAGFGRLTTPEAWLSTWSGLASRAGFARCAPGVTVPTLFIELTGDQAAFPADTRAMIGALGATDLTTSTIRGLHFGGAIAKGEPTGNELAAAEVSGWLAKRHELTPPG